MLRINERPAETSSFEELVRACAPRMLATAARIVGRAEAEDVVQDAFLSAFKAIDDFKHDAKIATWLHRIVINAALMRLRRRRARPEEAIDALLPEFDAKGHYIEATIDWAASADVALEKRETRALVRRKIEELPDAYREVFVLRDVEELDTEEVARLLGISEGAVKVRLHRARQALRTLLEREPELHR